MTIWIFSLAYLGGARDREGKRAVCDFAQLYTKNSCIKGRLAKGQDTLRLYAAITYASAARFYPRAPAQCSPETIYFFDAAPLCNARNHAQFSFLFSTPWLARSREIGNLDAIFFCSDMGRFLRSIAVEASRWKLVRQFREPSDWLAS